MRIAAIIPVYNRPSVVVEAMQSAADQTHPPECLIVVDDGSSDDTADRAEAWIRDRRPPFRAVVIRQDNAGPSVARNRGAQEAGDVDVLAYLDSDDLWPRDYLARVAAALSDHPEAVAATADRLNIDLTTGERSLLRCDRVAPRATRWMLVKGPPGTPNTAFRRTAFELCGGYEPQFRTGQDYHLLLRISLLGRWLHLPGEPVIVRRGIAETRSEATQNSKAFADRRLIRARMLDQFLMHDGGRHAMPGRFWRPRLGRMWYAAGRQLLPMGRRAEAAECFARAAEVYPIHLRAQLMSRLVR